MKVRWSPEAATDFEKIVEYIHKENPSAAKRVAERIYDAVTALNAHPNRGRTGRVRGTRELVLPPLPFVVVYRVQEAAVEIARVLHGSQRWP